MTACENGARRLRLSHSARLVINAVVMNVVLSYLATVRCWRVIVEGLSLARCSCH